MKLLQDTLREEFGKRHIAEVKLPKYFATSLNPLMTLRPYQEVCFKHFITYWDNEFEGKEPKPHLLFHMATGSGKTLIMAGVMLYLYEHGYRNFLFFVDSTNIIEKTKDNFLNAASAKYLFGQSINIGDKQIEIRLVDNFQTADENRINLCLTTIQGLHTFLNTPKENAITYDDFAEHQVVLISDEAHHTNTATKKKSKKATTAESNPILSGLDGESSADWESTVMRIFNSNDKNVLLEFTATAGFQDASIATKYDNKVIFDYPLKMFRKEGYSKDVSVIQCDGEPIDRAIKAVLLSQYRRKLFASIHQDIKPVIMLKSKTKADNKTFYKEFIEKINQLSVLDIESVKNKAYSDKNKDLISIFSYLEDKGISYEDLLLEIKGDFSEEHLLIVDGDHKDLTAKQQQTLNSLEDKNNEIRVIFAVDMLNEGWDVLNLFDIVRLYDTRDAKDNKPGQTTIQEAQLIGRGARYMPFKAPGGDLPYNKRKYDNDTEGRLRILETLHYHSATNPRYIQELHTALVETGMVDNNYREISIIVKDSFKTSRLYTDGLVFTNSQETFNINEDIKSIGDNISSTTFKVRLHSGKTSTKNIFDEQLSADCASAKYFSIRMKELDPHIIRAAINRFSIFRFDQLSTTFPHIKSVKEFIESDDYLANIAIDIYGRNNYDELSLKDKLYIAIDVLKQIELLLNKGGVGYKGSKNFTPKAFKDVFKDHSMKIVVESSSSEKEFGVSMKETTNNDLRLDLSTCEWHVYNDCFGTAEEKAMIKYIESIYSKLKEKYCEIYLVRNEKDLKLWSFKTGAPFEPDYTLFLRKRNNDTYDNIQIFIEPKGSHLLKTDAWKEECLKEIHNSASIEFSTQSDKFNIWGLPFFNQEKRTDFENGVNDCVL